MPRISILICDLEKSRFFDQGERNMNRTLRKFHYHVHLFCHGLLCLPCMKYGTTLVCFHCQVSFSFESMTSQLFLPPIEPVFLIFRPMPLMVANTQFHIVKKLCLMTQALIHMSSTIDV